MLFDTIESNKILIPGKSEEEINKEIYNLAFEMFAIQKYWHKRIVRCGENTLMPYKENPKNLILLEDDILFIDFGPIFEKWEADFGRTYVMGNDPYKIKLKNDIELAWHKGKKYFEKHIDITGAQLYEYCVKLASNYGWEFGGEIAGHLIGQYPHEKLEKEDKTNYIHPNNLDKMLVKGKNGKIKNWILEIHFVDRNKKIGGFFEQLLF
ncbi:MAG: aminopeptidase [Cryomorphaceae bacterium BACL29 MAG-121220-bin8]|nr:MAG: aminopeptidase [Cryomorphaceae bacterium BACL29 MAG-121220-bin8]